MVHINKSNIINKTADIPNLSKAYTYLLHFERYILNRNINSIDISPSKI